MQEIYYADDDADDIDIFTHAIQSIQKKYDIGVKLNVFNNGKKLMDAINLMKPKIGNTIFLDINMPGKTGFEVLSEIRSNADLKDIPVVMYSTSSDEKIINKSKILGAHLYAIKPNDINEMHELILKVLRINWASFIPGKENFIINHTI